MSPDMRRPPGWGANANGYQAESPQAYTDPHTIGMSQMASRIRWLERHRHWWLRTEDGRAQREFCDRRDAA